MSGVPQELTKAGNSARRAIGRGSSEWAPPRDHGATKLVARPLPPELDFLASTGALPHELHSALSAAPKNVLPLDAILGEGIIREEAYYRALARHLGCQYYSGDRPLALNFDPIKALRCGVAPLEGDSGIPRAVIAPRAQSVPLLIEATGSGRIRSGSFALTSPQRFASLVRAHRAEAILGDALERLPRALSASSGLSAAQICAIGGLAASACVLGAANFDALQAIASAGLWLTFSAAIVLRSMAAIATSLQTRPAMLSDDELPIYTVVAALYREADVVQDLVRAFDAFNYPKSKLDIKLVVERRDHETLARLVELKLPARYEVIIAPPGDPSTKPRALNIALSSARGSLLVVYDAEDAPSPDQLRLAALAAAGGGLSLWRELSDVYTYLLALAGIWTVILPLMVLARQRRLRLSAKALALLPAYYALISAATWVATVDLALRPHYWAKTVHGRSQRQIRPAFVPARAQR